MAFVTSLVMTSHDQPLPVGFVTSFLKIQFLIVTSDQFLVTVTSFTSFTSDQFYMTSDQFHAPLDQFLMTSDQFYVTSFTWPVTSYLKTKIFMLFQRETQQFIKCNL